MTPEPVAIVGMSALLPGEGTTIDAFWQMICQQRSARSEVPANRFNIDGFYHRNSARLDSLNTRHGSFVDRDLAHFDAAFFTISAAEAACMDPQQRILLETTYRAFENAGITMDQVAGSRTSTFIAGHCHDWETLMTRDPASQDKYQATGIGTALLAGRISHFYDLRGPSLVLDTACSSSGYAIHLACQSLRSGECDMSIVAGSSIILSPETMSLPISNGGFLSPDGICYSYDARANGYARAEGFAALVLKPLRKAIKDNDTIRSIIRATGVNQDGRTPSITQPSASAQERLIKETYKNFSLAISKTGFFEAHGTGTQVGDRIEASAIGACFRENIQRERLLVGSVKSNLGHLEGVSGLAAVIKSTLALETGLIPPNAWIEKLNPEIKPEYNKIQVPSQLTIWPTDGTRRVSINNFGYSGSNAHIVLDDAYHYIKENHLEHARHVTSEQPIDPLRFAEHSQGLKIANEIDPCPVLLVLSASDKAGPTRQAQVLEQFLNSPRLYKGSQEDLNNLAYTLGSRRTKLPWRSYLVWDTQSVLPAAVADSFSQAMQAVSSTKLVVILSGQGARSLHVDPRMTEIEAFQRSLSCSQSSLQMLGCKWSLREELWKKDSRATTNPSLAQTLTTCLQIALIDVLSDWKVSPDAIVGHSSGEIAGAYASGALGRDDAIRIAYWRGLLAENLLKTEEKSGMLAVALSAADCTSLMQQTQHCDSLHIGCLNSPTSTTLAGPLKPIQELKGILDSKGIFNAILRTGIAYHSPFMLPMAAEYKARIGPIDAPRTLPFTTIVPVYSSVTGHEIDAITLRTPEYWSKNLTSKVQFSDALQSFFKATQAMGSVTQVSAIELGPYGLLQQPVSEVFQSMELPIKTLYRSMLDRSTPSLQSSLRMAGHIYASGLQIDLDTVNGIAKNQCRVICNLPEYPFNHSAKHWRESDRSVKFRNRNKGRHELLGIRAHDWNQERPQWRNVFSVRDMPWLLDHKLQGSPPLYPAGGFLVAAIEAVRDHAANPELIKSFRLRDIQYRRPLLIDDTEPHEEWQLFLTKSSPGSTEPLPWYTFNVFSLKGGEYRETCTGEIRGENQDLCDDQSGRESLSFTSHCASRDTCTQNVDKEDFYRNIQTMGYEYGPFFQLLNSMSFDDAGGAAASINLRDWTNTLDGDDFMPAVIHPTTLDSFFQLPLVALTRGGRKPMGAMAAGSTKELWISSSLLIEQNLKLSLSAKKSSQSPASLAFDITAFDLSKGKALVRVESHAGAAITDMEVKPGTELAYQTLGYQMTYHPSMTLATNAEVLKILADVKTDRSDESSEHYIDQMEGLAWYYYTKLQSESRIQVPKRQQHLHRWWRSIVFACKTITPPKRRQLTERQVNEIIQNSSTGPPSLQGIVAIASHLQRILSDETTALEILFDTGLASRIYAAALQPLSQKVAHYMHLLAHDSSDLRIIEVGAGTGSVTGPVLSRLSYSMGHHKHLQRFSEYTFTDISSSFFESARERFDQHKSHMSFKVLDISKPLPQSDLAEETYDILIAAAVLHATPNIQETLQNCRNLLKSGGKIIILEPCNPSRITAGFTFGPVPGWWESQDDFREYSPLATESTWQDLLRVNGFSGIDFCFRDHDDPEFTGVSAIVSTAINPIGTPTPSSIKARSLPIKLLVEDLSSSHELANSFKHELAQQGLTDCELVQMSRGKFQDLESSIIVSLLDIEGDFLQNIDKEAFEIWKTIALTSHRILWLSQGLGGDVTDPSRAKMVGFGLTLSSERDKNVFKSLCFSSKASIETIVTLSIRVILREIEGAEDAETELRESNGLWEVGRLVPNQVFNDDLVNSSGTKSQSTYTVGERPLPDIHLKMGKPGLLNSLYFGERHEVSQLKEDGVLVQVKASSLNFVDVLTALGSVPGDELGFDAAGVVIEAGAKSAYQPGDRVLCAAPASLGTILSCGPLQVWAIPRDMSFAAAACLFTVFATAWYSLIHVGRLRASDTILIHAAAGGVGQAAIQIAKMHGVSKIFVTVGTSAKKNLLETQYDIPNGQIFSSRNESFIQDVIRESNGRGVDIILNCVAGELLQQTFKCLAPLGRMIEIGKRDMFAETGLRMGHFLHNVTFASVNLAMIVRDYPQLAKDIFDEVLPFLQSGQMREPRPLHIFPASAATDAFRLLQQGQGAGKVVVDFESTEAIQYTGRHKSKWNFDSNGSYVVAGGFGGVGRVIVKWMCDRGAKNVIVLSRTGRKNGSFDDLNAYAESCGARLFAPPCDITRSEDLASVLACIRNVAPVIKGCINSTMLIRDGLFENLSFESFTEGWRVKVDGSWNLFCQLPPNMGFHVMLSSVVGVTGGRGQSNYTVGNVFQDNLAHHARLQGRNFVTVDLGVQLDVGFLAENPALAKQLAPRGFTGIRTDDLIRQLEIVCSPCFCGSSSTENAQLITGIDIPPVLQALGHETPYWMHRPSLKIILNFKDLHKPEQSELATQDYAQRLQSANDIDEVTALILEGLTIKLSNMMSVSIEDFDISKPGFMLGVDSLIAIELRNWFYQTLKADITVFSILQDRSIAELSKDIAKQLFKGTSQ